MRALPLFACLTFLSLGVAGQMAIVEIEKPQVAKTVAGVVNDPSGAALPDVTVEERSDDWKTPLRSTQTDERGRFHFSPGAKTVYYLEFSRSAFNWPHQAADSKESETLGHRHDAHWDIERRRVGQ